MEINIITQEERAYTYSQSSQISAQSGLIGYLRADMGGGTEFFSTWNDFNERLKVDDFKAEINQVINALRFGPCYIDKHNNIIEEHDTLRFDDGAEEEVFCLEDGSKGISAMNPDYMKNHPDAEKRYAPLIASDAGVGLRKLHDAEITSLSPNDMRQNVAFCGAILESRDSLWSFCYQNPSASYGNEREWGIRVNTPNYAYLMRLNPNKGEYSLYCYCYQREWLDRHMQQARHGIRFVTPMYDEVFRIRDGDQIRITNSRGESVDRKVRYIDDYHIEVGSSFGSVYHICEFAEKMERDGNKVIPLRASLPETCFVYVPTEDAIGIVKKGEEGWYKTDIALMPTAAENKKMVAEMNATKGVSKAQAAAMSAGSMFGWDTKAADPAGYDENGMPQKRQRDRGDAR